MTSPFYWRHARDSLLTPTALRMFQLLAQHDGKRFDDVKVQIDKEYRQAIGTNADARHAFRGTSSSSQHSIRSINPLSSLTMQLTGALSELPLTPTPVFWPLCSNQMVPMTS